MAKFKKSVKRNKGVNLNLLPRTPAFPILELEYLKWSEMKWGNTSTSRTNGVKNEDLRKSSQGCANTVATSYPHKKNPPPWARRLGI